MVFHDNREEVPEDHRGGFRGGRGTPTDGRRGDSGGRGRGGFGRDGGG